ncbi:SOS response-associated peptidase [Dictyobacter aurantiacus]|uniref:Abasic site processing protein n=1 Tax=Dictyobacter aurantiacus TaxID=1936993 RepID=A0A401ZDZ4_9CHLR|nr:SOS response-associated peptidase [Dictyobacter aurantiacus]GCE05075.1 putative SOS response-associated peptidase YoqW [Dictyobacter aurantiacus]
MCGRFTLFHNMQDIGRAFRVEVPASMQLKPHYNVAPTQDIVTILNKDASPQLELLRWGLIPSWAKEESIGSRMINARAETLAEKPSFKRLLHNRRCLIVADGFYEWMQEPGSKLKTPMFITLKGQQLFAFAGLWDSWKNPDGEQIRTCTIITTTPNEVVAPIHNRMPAILTEEGRELWLDESLKDDQALLQQLKAYPAQDMEARPVSRRVNDTRYDSADLIA